MKKICALTLALSTLSFADEVKIYEPTGEMPMLSPEEALKTISLPDGYSLELVVAEPHIEEPAVIAFDGNGRMYVAELRTYMLDADGTGENEPTSRVSWHEDTNGDGKMDRHGVFIDNLLLPRIILPLDDRILIQETYTNDIYAYRDTNGDGSADEKKIWYKGGKRGGNMEHQPTGLIWSMDNHLYTTYNNYALKYNHDGTVSKESTGYGGQWGLAQDDYGKPWLIQAGSEIGPHHFQAPILYGSYAHSDEYPPGYREVFPLVGLPDVQSGTKRYRPDQKNLNHFTSACGQTIVRGSSYPSDLKGNLLFAEPVGRLIRRSQITVEDGVTKLTNSYPKSEFIRSTDPNFRPINMANAPDGTTYIVDMYRGIIQQASWTSKGSYLRKTIEAYGLEKNIGKGRIYRLVHKDHPRSKEQPNMLNESPAQLVAHLENKNGWWRDTAQKLLVLKNDKSVVSSLEEIAKNSTFNLARIHALWTLEGIQSASPELVRAFITDTDPVVRRAGLRVSESLYKAGDLSLEAEVTAAFQDSDPEVASQAILSSKRMRFPAHRQLIEEVMSTSTREGVKSLAKQIITGAKNAPPKLTADKLAQYTHGKEIHQMLCAACHGKDAQGAFTQAGDKVIYLAPSLANNPRMKGHPNISIKTLLHGLSGPLDGKTYSGAMISMESHGDQWIADVLSYLRYEHNDKASFISKEQVTTVKEKYAGRTEAWTQESLLEDIPSFIKDKSQWVVSASHNAKEAQKAIDGKVGTRYTTGAPMKNGMWYQVTLPEETLLHGCHIDYTSSPNDYPRGYLVEHSIDGENWVKLAEGKAQKRNLSVDHAPTKTKHIRITQTGGNKRSYWSIHELGLLTSS